MGDTETIGPSQLHSTGAGERLHFDKDRSNEHNAAENGIIADALIPWDFGSASTDPFELVCGTGGRLHDGEPLEIELLDEWSSETKMEDDRTASCEDLYGECQEKVDHSYCRLEKHNGNAVQRNNGKGGAATDGEENGVFRNLVLPPTKDGSGGDIMTLQDGVPPPLQNILIPPTREGSVENLQNGLSPLQYSFSRNLVLPPTKDGSVADSVTLQNGVSPLQKGVFPLEIALPPSGDGSIENLQNGGSCERNLPPTKDGALADIITLQNGASPLQNGVILSTADGSIGHLDNGSAPLHNLVLPLVRGGSMESSTTLQNGEEMPSTSQNGGNNEIGGVETRRNNMAEVLRPSVPYVDDLCLVLETCTISEDLEIITESNVDESNEITQILVHKPEETQHFIPEERQTDDMTQTLVLNPEETQTLSDGDSSVKEIPDPSESSVEKMEWLTSAFPADEDEIMLPFKALENTTTFGNIMPDSPSEMTAKPTLQNGHLRPDILMRPPLKCLNRKSSPGRMKRKKILDIELPLGGFSQIMESIRDNNRALHQNWGLPKWPKRSTESSGNGQRPLSKRIPPQIVWSVHGLKRRVDDDPLRTIKHPFSLPKMAAEMPQTSPFASLGRSSNMDPSRMTTGLRIASLADIFKPSKRTEETSLLKKLSALANKISAPWRSKPVSNIPKFGRKTIPDLLSSVGNMNDGRNVKKSNLQSPFSLLPLESASFCVLDLSSKLPLATPSFQFKMASVPIGKSAPAWEETHVRLPFEWTFSFLLSQNITGPVLNTSPVKKDGGFPVGLQTVLGLFSPGYSRLWARKWCFPARRLAFFQFTRASKDSNVPPSNPFASLLSATFANGLPTWRQFDPPSSEIPPLHSQQEVTSAISLPFLSPWMCLNLQNSATMLPPATGNSVELPVCSKDNTRWEPSLSASMPTFLSTPELPWSRLSATAFPARNSLEELEVPVPASPQSKARQKEAESEKRKPKKVSQIRIRKTIPKPDPNLTPMGLPRPKRLKKTEFSLEEIYTNKNYKSPPATRSLETIFEEPKERRGAWVWVSHQKRKRVLEFPDFTLPRKRRPRGRLRPVAQGFTRAQKATLDGRELDALLLQRLTDLEVFCARQEEQPGHTGS